MHKTSFFPGGESRHLVVQRKQACSASEHTPCALEHLGWAPLVSIGYNFNWVSGL